MHRRFKVNDPNRGHASRKGRRARAALVSLLLVGVLVIAGLLVRHREANAAKKTKRPPEAVTVTTTKAATGDIGVYLDAIGTVTPVYTASITSQVAGIVVAVHYREGQPVSKGEPLIDIDSRPYRATLLQAQGALERDTNLLAQADMDLGRYRDAWGRNAIAKQTLDDQEKIVLQDRGTVRNDEGTVQYGQVQVDYCHITAPISGRVGLRLVDPGNVVQSSGTVTLAVVTQLDPITVIFTIPEDNVHDVASRLRLGAKLVVDAYDRAGQTKLATGELLTIDNQIDTTTGTVKARAIFENQEDALFANQFVNTRLLLETMQAVTLLESAVIQHSGTDSFVYAVRGNVAHRQVVRPGVSEGALTEVNGVAAGDVIASSSFDKLHDGARVTLSSKPTPPVDGGPPP